MHERSDVDVVVIGSGAGGLAAALALAQAGKSVLVLEQHDVLGGWCHSFTLGGHRFSPGVHYIGELQPGGRMRRIYEGLGLADDLVFCELNPDGFDRVLIGGERFDIPKGKDNLVRRLQERFPAERAGIQRYFDTCEEVSHALDWTFKIRSLRDATKAASRALLLARWGLGSLEHLFDKTVQDPTLRAVLGAQSGDHGLPPSLVPAAVHASVVAHYFHGGWYPRGGAFTLPRAYLRALKREGARVRLSTPVDRILVERGHAIGVRLRDGEEIRASTVISNADPHATFAKLVAPEDLPEGIRRKLQRTRYSTSALSLFFATDLDLKAAGLDSANVWSFAGNDVEGAYRRGLEPWNVDGPEAVPAVFLTCTTLKDPSKRVGKQHTLEAFTFVHGDAFQRWSESRYGERPADYAAAKERLIEKMLTAIGRIVPELPGRVTFRELGTPLTNAHYCAATMGNLYGTEKTLGQIGPFGWPLQSGLENLWSCGASTLGHGVMGASVSGLIVAKQILGTSVGQILRGRGTLRCVPSDHPELWPEGLRARMEDPMPQPAVAAVA
jgi:all-trans-retinol 13,14-reductase